MSARMTPPLIVASAALACVHVGYAGAPPDYGLDWVTIDHPGNRAPTPDEVWFANPDYDYGAVDYTFRMTQTPVTLGQYFEFVEAYAPFADDLADFGPTIFNPPGADPFIPPGVNHDWAAQGPLRMAKRMANWLHNGKVNEGWAFESGAYDASTFGQTMVNGQTVYTDQVKPSPGATFWIPSLDEWTKANYYDPNRYGAGQEGYWLYPHQSQEAPIPGLPDEGGETDAGLPGQPGVDFPYFPVGSYPETQSAFGVLDASGGEREVTGSIKSDSTGVEVVTSARGGFEALLFIDELGYTGGTTPGFPGYTFRLASIPAPGACFVLAAPVAITLRRIRR